MKNAFEKLVPRTVAKTIFHLSITAICIMACNDENHRQEAGAAPVAEDSVQKGSFAYDLKFLQEHDPELVHLQSSASGILVSPKYQAKVFTSTASGDQGKSFGWINYKAFSTAIDPHMNAYGGENRIWLGPEGGKYSLFFKPGDSMTFSNWKTPAAFDTEAWKVTGQSKDSVSFQKDMELTNYAGTRLPIQLNRSVTLLDQAGIEQQLSVKLGDSVQAVGYATLNTITNKGSFEWTEKTGMPCIWILDMFNPSNATTIVIPYKAGAAKEKVATTGYFGDIPADRIRLDGKTLFFRADGKQRGKLGILPKHVLPVAGSYDAEHGVLTIISFTPDAGARYLNQEWRTDKPVFSGDAMNAYNDGPLQDGSQMGPFYEMESVSPAVALKAGASLQHHHNVFHFTGSVSQLNDLAQKILGVSLGTIQQAFTK